MPETKQSDTTPAARLSKVVEIVNDMETAIGDVDCVVKLLRALAGTAFAIQPEGLWPVADGLERAHGELLARFNSATSALPAKGGDQ
jgi:hypothetical protein